MLDRMIFDLAAILDFSATPSFVCNVSFFAIRTVAGEDVDSDCGGCFILIWFMLVDDFFFFLAIPIRHPAYQKMCAWWRKPRAGFQIFPMMLYH